MTSVKIESQSISFWEVLQLMFIYLKLTDSIGWHWVWVLAPTWIAFLLASLVAALEK
jgi:hypothetical protein